VTPSFIMRRGNQAHAFDSIVWVLNLFLVRRHITKGAWAEIRTAYALGIGLRELGRNMGIPAGTFASTRQKK